MLNKVKFIFSTVAVFLFSANFVFAEKIIFSASNMSGSTSGNSNTVLQGSAYIKTQTMEIKADKIELSGDDYEYIKAEGNVSGVNSESKMDFTCDVLTFDRTTKIAALEGNVNLIDKENDVNAKAQLIEFNQDTGIAVLQIKVNITQKNNICSCAYAVYQQKEQKLELSGNAQVKQDSDTFRAQLINLDMETQDITLDGNVKGTITETSKKEERTSGSAPETEKTVPSDKKTSSGKKAVSPEEKNEPVPADKENQENAAGELKE